MLAFLAFAVALSGVTAKSAARAYLCDSHYTEEKHPSPLSQKNPLLLVCIAAIAGPVECQTVVDVNLKSKKLVVAGEKQPSARALQLITPSEVEVCMVKIVLTDDYFVKDYSPKLVMSGSVKMGPVNATAGTGAKSAEFSFSVAFSLLKGVKRKYTTSVPSDKVTTAIESATAYQCTSDYVKVTNPPAILQKSKLLRVCITGTSTAVECTKIIGVAVRQSSSDIKTNLVEPGPQSAFADVMETTYNGTTCMLTAVLKDKYFTKRVPTASDNSLQVVVSGSVSMAFALADRSVGSNVKRLPSRATTTRRHMAPKKRKVLDIPFELAVNLLSFRDTDIESATAYQCDIDYAKVPSPPAISQKKGKMLRVCITGPTAVECRKIVEVTMRQASSYIEDKLDMTNQERLPFADMVMVTYRDKTCMLSAVLKDKFFIKAPTASDSSLQVVVSGSVAMGFASKTTTKITTRADMSFELAVNLTAPAVDLAAITAYQCHPNRAPVTQPHPIFRESKMLRVCITGASTAVECRKFVELNIRQASNAIEDKLVVAGKNQPIFADLMEITYHGQVCMVAAYLGAEYFIKAPTDSDSSLQVVMSGSVAMEYSNNHGRFRGTTITTKRGEALNIPFEIAVDLSSDEEQDDDYHVIPWDAASDIIYNIAAIRVMMVIMMLI